MLGGGVRLDTRPDTAVLDCSCEKAGEVPFLERGWLRPVWNWWAALELTNTDPVSIFPSQIPSVPVQPKDFIS